MMPEQKPGRSKQTYGTPPDLLKAIKIRLDIDEFDMDLAASETNAVASLFMTEEANALIQRWPSYGGWNWCNPPFANIEPWVKTAYNQSRCNAAQTVMLLPSAVGSNWWKSWVEPYAYVVHLNGRLIFVGETSPYPKDCSLLFYTSWGFKGTEVWDWRRSVPQLCKPEPSKD